MGRFRIYWFFIGMAVPLCFSAQVNLQFVAHLNRNQLHQEHYQYLIEQAPKISADSANYLWAKYFLAQQNPKKFQEHFLSSVLLFRSDTAAMNIASAFLLRHGNTASQIFETLPDSVFSSFYSRRAQNVIRAVNSPTEVALDIKDEKLQAEFSSFRRFYKKRPFVGGLLSAVVPGLGKCYAGRPVSFLNVFFAHVLYGVTIYENIKRVGIKNPYAILHLGYCGTFYLANIYGGYQEVKKAKAEKRKQVLLNAAQYIDHNSNSDLYPKQ